MTFLNPAALWLLVAVAAIGIFLAKYPSAASPRRGVVLATRLAALTLLVVAIARPVLHNKSRDPVRVAIFDLSAAVSAAELSRAVDSLKARQSESANAIDDILAFSNHVARIDDLAILTDPNRLSDLRATLTPPRHPSDPAGGAALADALQLAGALIPPDRHGEIRLYTPARQTRGDAVAELTRLSARNIAVHATALTPHVDAPFVLTSAAAPPTAAVGQTIPLRFTLESQSPRRATAQALIAGQSVASLSDIPIGPDPSTASLPIPLLRPGVTEIELVIFADNISQSATTTVWVAPPRRVTIISAEDASTLTKAFADLLGPAAAVSHVAPDSPDLLATLDATELAILADLPAALLPTAVSQHLRTRVEGGMGLLFTGDARSFGPGGWGESPVASLMPVSMPQLLNRPDPSAAVVFIIDTSGSMGEGRIALAKEVAHLTLRRLQSQDKAGIVEFHGAKRWAAPIQSATNRVELTRALNRLSPGGGTEIYPALEEAAYALRNVNTRTRHVVIITDGGVESVDFETLIRRMADIGQTVSTVVIGNDPSPLMESMAEWGHGRFYRVTSRLGVPEILLHRPQSDTPPPVVESPSRLSPRDSDDITRDIDFSSLPPIEGYVRVVAKAHADVLLQSESADPILTRWRVGRGRVAALSTRLASGWTASLSQSPAAATLLSNLCRSLYALPVTEQLAIRPMVRPAGVEVHIDDLSGSPDPLATPINLQLVSGPDVVHSETLDPIRPATYNTLLKSIPPGRYTLRATRPNSPVSGTAALTIPVPTLAQSYKPDQTFFVHADAMLKSPPPPASSSTSLPTPLIELTSPFVLVAMVLFLLHILIRRLPARVASLAFAVVLPLATIASAQSTTATTSAAEEDDIVSLKAELLQRTASETADADAFTRLANVLELTGDLPGAADALEKAAKRTPDAVAASALLRRRAVLQIESAHPDAWASLPRGLPSSLIALAYGRPDLAADFLPADQPATFHHLLLRGTAQLDSGNPTAALQSFDAAIALAANPRDRRFAAERVVAAARAAGTLRELVDRWLADPDPSADRLQLLAGVLRELDRVDDLLALWRRAAARRPGAEPVLTPRFVADSLGAAEDAGRLPAVEEIARAMWERDPTDPFWLGALVDILITRDRPDDADAAIRTAADRCTTGTQLLSVASVALRAGRTDAAIATASSAERLPSPADRVAAHLFVAAAHRRRADLASAEQSLARAAILAGSDSRLLRDVADAYEKGGNLPRAIALYESLGDSEEILRRLAWLYRSANRPADAQKTWATLARTASAESRRRDARSRMLELAASAGTIGDLVAELEDRLAARKADLHEVLLLVDIYVGIRDPFSAADVLKRSDHLLGGELPLLRHLAELYQRCGQFGLADRTLRQLLEKDPTHAADTLQQLAALAIERDRPQDALAALQQLAALDETGASHSQLAASVYTQLDMHLDAAAEYRRLLSTQPDRAEDWILWANAMKKAGRQHLAVRRLLLLAVEAASDEVFAVAVDGLLNMEAPRDALRVARRAALARLASSPEKLLLYELTRELSDAVGDSPGASRVAELSLLIAGEQRTDLLREMITLANATNQPDRSLAYQRTLLALGDFVPPQVFLDIGRRLLADNRFAEAGRAFRRAEEMSDDDSTRRQIADLYERAGEVRTALRLLEPLLRKSPDSVELHSRVAQIHEQLGAFPAALDAYTSAITLVVRQGNIGPGLKPARPFDEAASKSVTDAERYLDALFRGALNSARTEESQTRLLALARSFVDAQLARTPASIPAVDPALADLAKFHRRLAFALRRPDLADDLDLLLLQRHPDDQAFLSAITRERTEWGLETRAAAFSPGPPATTTPTTDPASPTPDFAAELLPRLLLAGEVDQARAILSATRTITPADGGAYVTLIACACALDDEAAAWTWTRLWLDSATGQGASPDASRIIHLVRSAWPALNDSHRRALLNDIRAALPRTAGPARAQLALQVFHTSVALNEPADARAGLAVDAATVSDLNPTTLANLLSHCSPAERPAILDTACAPLTPERRRWTLLQTARILDIPLDETSLRKIAGWIGTKITPRQGHESGWGFNPPGRTAPRPELWRAVASALSAIGDDRSIEERILTAQAHRLAGDSDSADESSAETLLILLSSDATPNVTQLVAAAVPMSASGADSLLASPDLASLPAARRALLAAVLADRAGRDEVALDHYRQAFALSPENPTLRNQLVTRLRENLRWADLLATFAPYLTDRGVVDDFVRGNLATARREGSWLPHTDNTVFALYANRPFGGGDTSQQELRRFRVFHQYIRERRQYVVYPARPPVRTGGLPEYDRTTTGRQHIYQALSIYPWAADEYLGILRGTPNRAPESEGILTGLAMVSPDHHPALRAHLERAASANALTDNDRTLLLLLFKNGFDPGPVLLEQLKRMLQTTPSHDSRRLGELIAALRAKDVPVPDSASRYVASLAAVTRFIQEDTATDAALLAVIPPGEDADDLSLTRRLSRLADLDPVLAADTFADFTRRRLLAPATHPRATLVGARLAAQSGDWPAFESRLAAGVDAWLPRTFQRIPDLTLAMPAAAFREHQPVAVMHALAVLAARRTANPSDARDLTRIACILGRWAVQQNLPDSAAACLDFAAPTRDEPGEHRLWIADLLRLLSRPADADELELSLLRINHLPPTRADALLESLKTTHPHAIDEAQSLIASRKTSPTTRPR